MRYELFETVRPRCPVCNTEQLDSVLKLASIDQQESDQVIEGRLECPNGRCRREYPIIDGIPLIIRDLRHYLQNNASQLCMRSDLSTTTGSMLGDCLGPSSSFNTMRQQLSSYIWDHYGEFDPEEICNDHAPKPGALARLLNDTLESAELNPVGSGPILDLGCGVGRTTFELAARFNRPTLGIDLHFPMLQVASHLTRSSELRYARRSVGLVYQDRRFQVPFRRNAAVDFWACDATALPFARGLFSAAISFNVLDCVHSPIEMLMSLGAVLGEGAKCIVSSPYDWSESATTIESWLGGHSQRGIDHGSSELVVRRLLEEGSPDRIPGLKLLSDANHPWQVRLHDRSYVNYQTHVCVIEKIDH
ncbi:methyltransferase domain-containing protein [Roseiconus lacunae]|uniref:methyltransferase domain-containing protein n=1 Tax=Roseiconus lacunae TaxID=2605694 RepID=UPI0011F2E865|nr:methyltransferase domain-containing protein [Roseiconus lacunae]